MDMENSSSLIKASTKGTGCKTKSTAKVSSAGPTVVITAESGLALSFTALAPTHGQMVVSIKENTSMIKSAAKVSTLGLMEKSTTECGKMESNTVKVNSPIAKESPGPESGTRVPGKNGLNEFEYSKI